MSKINFFALGGVQEDGKNLYVADIDNKIFIMDCGNKMPTADLHGVDIVINDYTYLLENRDRIVGLFLSHAHQDHIGGVSHLITKLMNGDSEAGIDANPNYKLQIDVTNKVLDELGCKDIPILYVYNKCDLLDEQFFPEEDNAIMISAKTGFNLKLLATTIKTTILNEVTTLELFIPYDRGDLVNKIRENENLLKIEYKDNCINLLATIKNKNLHIYEEFKKAL
jgi:ribonuclease BN (tRNA processing enzyme)